eukprot:4095514-Prymnesium_polylepis.1
MYRQGSYWVSASTACSTSANTGQMHTHRKPATGRPSGARSIVTPSSASSACHLPTSVVTKSATSVYGLRHHGQSRGRYCNRSTSGFCMVTSSIG